MKLLPHVILIRNNMSKKMTEEDNAIAWVLDIPQRSAKQVLLDDKQNMYTLRFWLGDNKFIVYYGDGEANGYDERPLPDVDSPPRLQPDAQKNWDVFSERLRTEAIQVSFLKSGHLYDKTGDEIAKILVAATPETWEKKWWKNPGEFHRVCGNSTAKSDAKLRTIFIGNIPNDITFHAGSYTSKDSTDFLTCAILATFLDFDLSVSYDIGDLTKLVWWRYREATRRCSEVTRLVKSQLAEFLAATEIQKESKVDIENENKTIDEKN